MTKRILVLLVFLSNLSATQAMEEKWTLKINNVCDRVSVNLPLPSLDYECNLDNKSGNPSNWFNPFETCEIGFDMIGLPSIGDIMAGVSGAICEEIQDVKEKTIDDLIDDINEQIPENLTDDVNIGVDLNEKLDSIGDWRDDNNAQPDQEHQICYTTNHNGQRIAVPCDIAQNPSDLNKCYFKSGNYSSPFTPVECGRYTKESEQCIARWERDNETGIRYPVISSCTAELRSLQQEACTINGQTNYCTEMALRQTITQNERVCSIYDRESKTRQNVPCSTIEKACYGHLNGSFQAASCLTFHNQLFNNLDPFADYEW
ncbi:exported hypothetical protein [Vibrio nigripulchritudo SOn1]|uniref:Uncharacterized protein n=1 Tax=Vibrio nigripulchritudo SOn1 TaxID=1238450 RepID=A0AAV2VQX6_9VIBR|nr:hypothetical protein [Vibrio nigripulchritudo]CCO46829.1 exported hypothetical protein [Vibrio nigripulchritudo SOn1]